MLTLAKNFVSRQMLVKWQTFVHLNLVSPFLTTVLLHNGIYFVGQFFDSGVRGVLLPDFIAFFSEELALLMLLMKKKIKILWGLHYYPFQSVHNFKVYFLNNYISLLKNIKIFPENNF